MDDLTSEFGAGLSLNAMEWKPGGSRSTGLVPPSAATPHSDLKATAVKEFVPGQGWSAAGKSSFFFRRWRRFVMFWHRSLPV